MSLEKICLDFFETVHQLDKYKGLKVD